MELNAISTATGILLALITTWLAVHEWYRGSTERSLEDIRLLLDVWHREWRELHNL